MTANSNVLVIGALLLSCSSISQAQQDLAGTYSGSFEFECRGRCPRGPTLTVHVKLELASIDAGKATGTWLVIDGHCKGAYAVAGTLKDSNLVLKVDEGALKDCGGGTLRLAAEGGKLKGKLGKRELELSK